MVKEREVELQGKDLLVHYVVVILNVSREMDVAV